MRGIVIGVALCALAAGPAQAETCRGRRDDQYLVRVTPGTAPLFLAMHWNGRPEATRAVSVRCLRHGGPGSGPERRGRGGR